MGWFRGHVFARGQGEFFRCDAADAERRLDQGREIFRRAGLESALRGFIPPAWLLSRAAREVVDRAGFEFYELFDGIVYRGRRLVPARDRVGLAQRDRGARDRDLRIDAVVPAARPTRASRFTRPTWRARASGAPCAAWSSALLRRPASSELPRVSGRRLARRSEGLRRDYLSQGLCIPPRRTEGRGDRRRTRFSESPSPVCGGGSGRGQALREATLGGSFGKRPCERQPHCPRMPDSTIARSFRPCESTRIVLSSISSRPRPCRATPLPRASGWTGRSSGPTAAPARSRSARRC